ncbi:MAG: NAD(P)-binding domain-containing protein [Ancrocorticia sp.]|uniref:NAD(P)-binding domain-containing protein n=1 Tax=Ancrocorticia sp. TaxID=2593684 RepID=UPI003F8F4299
MRIAFLGTGRMGTELALRLIEHGGHDITVWNRTAKKAQRVVEAGAELADDAGAAIRGADLVVTCLFGPATVREIVTGAELLPEGTVWADGHHRGTGGCSRV